MFKNYQKIIFIFLIFFTKVNAETVNNILVIGNDRINSNTIVLFSKIKIGDNLNNNDLNNITKRIYNTNFFKDVIVNLTDSNLKISVVERAVIQNVSIVGVKNKELKKELLKNITNQNSSSYNDFFIRSDLKLIQNILQNLGYYFSKIEASTQDNNNKTINLIFDIDLGKKSYIEEIIFLGDKKFKSGNLQNIIASEENKFWKNI